MTSELFYFKLVIIYSLPYELMQLTTCHQYLHLSIYQTEKKTNRRLSGYEQFSMPQHNKCYLFFFETSTTSEFGESLSWRCPRWAESFSINALFLNNSASSMISCTTEVWTSSEPFKLPTRSKIASSPAWQKESLWIKSVSVCGLLISHLTGFPFWQ